MISGFSCLRNGVLYDYPFRESIRSILPIVDEMVIAIDPGEDSTLSELKLLQTEPLGEKLILLETKWPLDSNHKLHGGVIISEQTNIALNHCRGDWCIYLQSDEVLHEDDHPKILSAINSAKNSISIEGLLFSYNHFYGSYNVVQRTRSAYRREVRAIRKSTGVKSIGDGQSFRKLDGSKLKVILVGASIYHYGWVRPPEAMRKKTLGMDQLYHGKTTTTRNGEPHTGDNYRYKKFWGLKPYCGSHPVYMSDRIRAMGWKWDLKNSPFTWKARDFKKVLSDFFEGLTGIRPFEYKSYRLIRRG